MKTMRVVASIFTLLVSSQFIIVPSQADGLEAFGPTSPSRFKLLAEYAPGSQYRGKPLVKSIFNDYTESNSDKDSLVIREDFESLYIVSSDYVVVSPYGKSPTDISSDQNKNAINASRQYILSQGQAALRWVNALGCSIIYGTNGQIDHLASLSIDKKAATEFSGDSSYPELRGLPGLSSRGGGGPVGGAYVSNESWFQDSINFAFDTSYIEQNQTEDSPEGYLLFQIPKEKLSNQFNHSGKVNFEYGMQCSNGVDPSFNFRSTQKLEITIMPKSGVTEFTYQNPVVVSIKDKAIDIDVASLNQTTPILMKTLTPSICSTFATSVLLKKVGVCKVSIIQAGNEDFASASENFSFVISKPIICTRGKSTVEIIASPQKCPTGYKKKT